MIILQLSVTLQCLKLTPDTRDIKHEDLKEVPQLRTMTLSSKKKRWGKQEKYFFHHMPPPYQKLLILIFIIPCLTQLPGSTISPTLAQEPAETVVFFLRSFLMILCCSMMV